MDRGGCQMSGGDRIAPEQSGMITLEDLESFSEDQLSDSGNGSLEEEAEMLDEDDDRLLRYWQDVARGHQVEVSQGKNKNNISKKIPRCSVLTTLMSTMYLMILALLLTRSSSVCCTFSREINKKQSKKQCTYHVH